MTSPTSHDPSAASGDSPDDEPKRPLTTPATYQQSLDEALDETFPASDPISPSALQAQEERLSTRGNAVDWPLHADSARAPLDPRPAALLGALGMVLLCRRAGPIGWVLAAAAGSMLGAFGAGVARGRRPTP